LGSQCTSYLQQHKPVLTCVAWGADRKDAVLHNFVFKKFTAPLVTASKFALSALANNCM
jgi:hypothetical protein